MKTPIIDALLKYKDENILRLHMPGHKGRTSGFELLNTIKENLYEIDLTEIDETDNLHNAEGIINESQIIASNIFNCYKSFYLINGSTSGIYSMILSAVNKGDKIIVQRNCHKSVFMAAFLGELDIEYISPTVSEKFGFGESIDVNIVKKVIEENKDAKAIVLTSPSYYGTCADIEAISKITKKYNILLIVDSAHGAHFAFSDKLPKTAINSGADMEVVSLHKTLPSLTQTGILNISKECINKIDINKLKLMLSIYQTSSPSYVFMSSIEASLAIMKENGEVLIEELLRNINIFKEKLSKSCFYKILKESRSGLDKTRIVIYSKIGGKALSDILRKDYRIQVEMADLNNIVIIGSVFDSPEDYIRLYNALAKIEKNSSIEKCIESKDIFDYKYKKSIKIHEAYLKDKEEILIQSGEGRICSEMITPYPPGIPLLVPGEIITKDKIDFLMEYKSLGIEVNGTREGYIKVIK